MGKGSHKTVKGVTFRVSKTNVTFINKRGGEAVVHVTRVPTHLSSMYFFIGVRKR